MKGKKLCYGLLLVCSIIFGFLLNGSSDANAITFTMELQPTGNEWTNPDTQCWYGSGSAWRTSTGTDTKWTCNNPQSNWDGDIDAIRTVDSFHVEEGNYYQVQMVLRNNNRLVAIPEPIYWNFYNDDNFTNVGLEVYYEDERQNQSVCQYSYTSNGYINSSVCNNTGITYNAIMIFTIRANSTGDVRFQIGTTTAVLIRGNYSGASPSDYIFTFGMKKITEFQSSGISEMNQKDDEDRSNIESQSSDIDSDAADSSSDAESAGTTLLGAFSGFVSALTSTQPGNCVLDMDLGNLDMGNVDFCTLSPPAGFSAIASVFMILFCVPLSISTARKIISLFRSFQ